MENRVWSRVVLFAVLAQAGPASADVTDDLRCYKIKDPLKLSGIVDFSSTLSNETGCKLKAGAFVCVPGTSTVTEAKVNKAPVTLLPVDGSELRDYRVCYKLSCPSEPLPQEITDRFGARSVATKKTGLLCTPALSGLLDPDCTIDATCDDGDPCNGFEQCTDYHCASGTPIGCQPGDMVFVSPFQDAPIPAQQDLAATPRLDRLDVYLLLDRSASMSSEVTNLKNNGSTVVSSNQCSPEGTGSPPACIPGLFAGAGTTGYSDASPYNNLLDVQPSPSFSSLVTTDPSSSTFADTHLAAMWSSATGLGSSASGCGGLASYVSRVSCSGSPAGDSGVGYPCFRPDSLPVIMVTTDEAPSANFNCPVIAVTAAAANTISARIVGLLGSGSSAGTRSDMESLATLTDAVDGIGSPLVFDAFDTNAAAAFSTAIQAVRDAPLDTRAILSDDPGDGVDAVAAFVDRVATLPSGTPSCTSGLTEQDSNGDTFADEFVSLAQQTPVCWRLQAKPNTSVPATDQAQVFPAMLQVQGARRAAMGTATRVLFVVPPQ